MSSFFKELGDYHLIEKVFSCFRLIDTKYEKVISEYFTKTGNEVTEEFLYEKLGSHYESALKLGSTIYKIEKQGENWELISIIPISFNENRCVLECSVNITESLDVLKLSDNIEQSYRLSITDDLTGVFNRRYINDSLPEAVRFCANKQVPLSILFTDLDSFKEINDIYGHTAGDYVLYNFAVELQRNIRQGVDWVARYGGDEFLVCLVGADRVRAGLIAERVRKSLEKQNFIYSGNIIKITCSIGTYTIEKFGETLPSCDVIINEADKRLYRAKRGGKNKSYCE